MVKRQRPTGIKLACVLIWIGAALSILGSAMALFLGSTLALTFGLGDFTSMFAAAGIISLILGILVAILGYFLWQLNTVAWYIAFILTILGLVGGVMGLFTAFGIAGILSLLISILQFFALADSDSIKACKVGFWRGIDTPL